MSSKICHACTEANLCHCCYPEGEIPEGMICKYELANRFISPKLQEKDKRQEVRALPTIFFQDYQNMEGRKLYHIYRTSSFYFSLRLYIDDKEVASLRISWDIYDETLEEVTKAGFVEGFYSHEVTRKKKDYEKAKQEYEYALNNMIKEDDWERCYLGKWENIKNDN